MNHVRSVTKRTLKSLFGGVIATRECYSQLNKASQFPMDVEFNLSDDSAIVTVSDTEYQMRLSEALLMMLLKQFEKQPEVMFLKRRA